MSECDVILNQGIRDKETFTSLEDIKSYVKEALSWTYETFVQNRSKSGGGGKIKIFSYLELSGNGQSEQQAFEGLKASYQSLSEKFFEQHSFQNYYKEITNETVVNAWLKCVTNQTGILGYFTGDPTDSYTLILRYKPDEATDAPATITGISAPYSTAIGDRSIYVGSVIRPFTSLAQTYSRTDAKRTAAITITFNNRSEVVINLPTVPTVDDLLRMIKAQNDTITNLTAQYAQFQQQHKIDVKQYDVKPNAAGQEKCSFLFPVKHAWIEVIDSMDFVKNVEVLNIVDKTVEFSWTTTRGAGRPTTHVNFRLWAAGF